MIRKRMLAAAAAFLLCAVLFSSDLFADASLQLVENGQGCAVVLVEASAGSQVRAAAQKLAQYVHKATGVVFPYMTEEEWLGEEEEWEDCARIRIGPASGLHPDVSAALLNLDDDGFVIHTQGEEVTIVGPTAWGTEFGVDEFLERYVGVRWLMPGPNGEDVPQLSALSVPNNSTLRIEPAAISRQLSGLLHPSQTEWARHNRMHARIGFHHNLYKLFPPARYGQSHPEFYPLRNGQPWVPTTNTGWQPCFTEPATVQEAVYTIIAYFNQNPGATTYSLGMNDSGGFCEAQPGHPHYPGTFNSLGYVDMSDIYYGWVNQVAAGVLQAHPDKYFGLLAYREVFDPPSFPLNARVIPFITDDRMSWGDTGAAADAQLHVQSWQGIASQLGFYDYLYGAPYLLPRVYGAQMADNYRFGEQNGVKAHYAELYPNWGEGPKPWMALKLQWDPSLDEQLLLEEWSERAVGPAAAPDLVQFYAHWEQFWSDRIFNSDWYAAWNDSDPRSNYLPFSSAEYLELVGEQEIADSRQLLESAVAKASTPEQQARANLLLQAFEYYEASALSYPRPLPGAPANDTEAIALLAEQFERVPLAQLRMELLDQFASDPVLMHPITPQGLPQALELRWNGISLAAITELAEWLRQQSPGGAFETSVLHYANGSSSATVRNTANLLLALAGKKTALASNASFETGSPGSPAAPPWYFWFSNNLVNLMHRSDDIARTGDYSLRATLSRGGPVQFIPVQPGEYGAVAYYYAPPGTRGNGTVQIVAHLFDANNVKLADAHMASDTGRVASSQGEWVPLAAFGTIPAQVNGKTVASVQLIVIVNGLTASEPLYLDDVNLFRMD